MKHLKRLTPSDIELYSFSQLITEISVYIYAENEQFGLPLFESMVDLSVISANIAKEFQAKYVKETWEENDWYKLLFGLCDEYIQSIRKTEFEVEIISIEKYKRTYKVIASNPAEAEKMMLEDESNGTVLDVEFLTTIDTEIKVK